MADPFADNPLSAPALRDAGAVLGRGQSGRSGLIPVYRNALPARGQSSQVVAKDTAGVIDYFKWDGSAWVALGGAAHDAVTLAADADVLLGLSTQQITLDTQTANLIFSGPASGPAADPTFRALVSADLPAAVVETTDTDWVDLTDSGSTTLHSHAGGAPLTVQELDLAPSDTDVTIIRVPNNSLTDNGVGDVTLTVAPKDARYFTFGLNSVLTNEHSLDEADESTLPATKDVHWKWLTDTERLFRISNDGGGGTGVMRILFQAGDTVTFELGTIGQAFSKLQFDDQGFGYGPGTVGADTRISRIDTGRLGVSTGKFRVPQIWVARAAQNITAASQALSVEGYLAITANASYTLTSVPTIAAADDGQIMIIVNVDTVDTITLQDQGTLAGSNLRLGATTRALGPRDSIMLIYDSVVADWVELNYNTVL